jgi:catechol 2,3-dioxygenase-like lactoylglutathione lyase family enzyme
MRVEHVAIWTPDLERLRAFYERYFDARRATGTKAGAGQASCPTS